MRLSSVFWFIDGSLDGSDDGIGGKRTGVETTGGINTRGCDELSSDTRSFFV